VITLVFLIIELKRNVNQTRTMNLINRDNQYYKYTDYWAEFENIDTVIKGRKIILIWMIGKNLSLKYI